ncbi:NUDIX domain-containing protein [Woodsholea maritima]|uniref:NUDIX domain-containing protein n=1 Tax=Woodsholea maritima TaxID=240237 RepID=UPI00037F91DD|nr:NUDIX hydrolase [Woodsholea maritima]
MTERRRGPWIIHGEKIAYDTPWMTVTDYQVTCPDGSPSSYGVMSPKNLAIGIVPLFDNGDVMLVGQYRFALDAYSWELPEGGGPKGDIPLASAKRELKEETGLSADHWQEILGLDLSNSITDECAHAFLAWGLTQGEAEPEGTEDITIQRVPFQTALKMAMMGDIRDAFTLVMLAKVDYMARRGDLPEALCQVILAQPQA